MFHTRHNCKENNPQQWPRQRFLSYTPITLWQLIHDNWRNYKQFSNIMFITKFTEWSSKFEFVPICRLISYKLQLLIVMSYLIQSWFITHQFNSYFRSFYNTSTSSNKAYACLYLHWKRKLKLMVLFFIRIIQLI